MKRLNKFKASLGIVAFTLVTTSIFSLRNNSYADVSAPYAYDIDIVITNKDGAECKDDAGGVVTTISYGTVMSGKDIEYVGNDTYWTQHNGSGCTILGRDVGMANENFDFSIIKEAPAPLTQYIIGDDSCLYKGPREEYGRADDEYCLPQGITVTSTYYDDLWMYVEYNGHGGWIYHHNIFNKDAKTADIATDEWNRVLVTTRGRIELKNTPYEGGKVIATIEVPALTEIPVLYSFSTSKYESENYISYGNYSGWYHKNSLSYDVAFPENENGMIAEEGKAKVFNQVDSDVTTSVIPANSKVSVLYTSRNGFEDGAAKAYVEWYDSNAREYAKGWIDEESYAKEYGKFTSTKDLTLKYDQPVFGTVNGKKTGDVKEGETYKVSYYYPEEEETWYYINDSAKHKDIGWIKSLTSEEVKALEEQRRKKAEEMLANSEPEDIYVYEITDNIENSKDTEVVSIILWLLIGTIVIAGTIVIVLAVKKHKKAKSPEADKDDNSGEQKTNEDKPIEEEQAPKDETTEEKRDTEHEIAEEKQETPVENEGSSSEDKK